MSRVSLLPRTPPRKRALLLDGYLLVGNGYRRGTVAAWGGGEPALWDPGTLKFAQYELPLVLMLIIDNTDVLRGSRGVIFIDNIAALMAMVRGRSRIESRSNWADAISRAGVSSTCATIYGFTV